MINLYLKEKNEQLESKLAIDFTRETALEIKTYSNSYVLPCKKFKNVGAYTTYSGGVCSKNFSFIAGLTRHDECNHLSYTIDHSHKINESEALENIEECIFGGVIIDIFGHTITESISRLWFLRERTLKNNIPIIFVNTGNSVPEHFFTIIDLLGIKSRVIIADKPFFAKTIHVPDQSLVLYSRIYCKYFNSIYDEIKGNISSSFTYDKIYLTRSHYYKKDCIGEEIFEEQFKNNNFKIIAPEEYSLEEQIGIIHSAKEIVCTIGTLSHLAILFCKPGTKLTFIIREMEIGALGSQLVLNQSKDCDISLIDSSFNLLPTTHAGGIFLMLPNDALLRYFDDNKLSYDKRIVETRQYSNYLFEYLVQYTNTYSRNGYAFKRVANQDIFDVIKRLSKNILNVNLKRESFGIESKSSMKDKITQYEALIENRTIRDISDGFTNNIKCLDIFQKDDELRVGNISHDIGKIKERIGIDSPGINEVLPILYTIDNVDYEQYDIIKFENKAKQFRNTDLLENNLINNVDIILYRVQLNDTICRQYIKCHGQRSWDVLMKAMEKDKKFNNIYNTISNKIRYLFAKNIFIIKSEEFYKFSKWYKPIIESIIENITSDDTKLISNISERVMTIYFVNESFSNNNILTTTYVS